MSFVCVHEHNSVHFGTESLQCPRCNAPVPAHPGVCAACGENAHQCQKCRTINYDERDPFLCISCGFSKYARFETLVEGRPTSAVDPIETEDDRKKTLLSINQLLERADKYYKELVTHRNELDQLLISLASEPVVSQSSSDSGVNRAIQLAAHLYCNSCKSSYTDLSKIIQSVLASRRELVAYDINKLHSGKVSPTSEPATPLTPISGEGSAFSLSSPVSTAPLSEGNCFGCASATLEHCITVLKALAFKPETRKLMKKDLIEELMEFNLRTGSVTLQKDVQGLLCQLTRLEGIVSYDDH
uniref:E3 ubiquitin-protein ligase UBR4-like domain-containing protein n=2 Tax=Amphimedon queenslandica TaxID=400682 RepID=A0A1X7SMH9_AMPQE